MQDTPKKTILIVDDDLFMQKLLSKLLNNLGFNTVSVNNGQEAMNVLEYENIALVITDLNMPSMNGAELCEAIRAKNFQRYVYIIVITAQNDSQSLVDSMQSGADDYISKPLNSTELIARLKAGLRIVELEEHLNARNGLLNNALSQIKLEQEEAKLTLYEILPQPMKIGGAQFNWIFESSSFIGGDIFDYFPLGKEHLCFYVADVAGHGVTAALQAYRIYNDMGSSTKELESMIASNKPLTTIATEFIASYNNQFLEKKCNDSYFTMCFGLLNFRTGEMALLQAGHPAAMYIDPDSDVIQMIGDGGFPVGMFENATYEATSMYMKVGSRLCIYSDGVTDCENNQAEIFGQEKLIEVISEKREETLNEVLLTIDNNLKKWKNNNESYKDDITCLFMAYHGYRD